MNKYYIFIDENFVIIDISNIQYNENYTEIELDSIPPLFTAGEYYYIDGEIVYVESILEYYEE